MGESTEHGGADIPVCADRQECLSYLVAWAGEHVAGDGGLQCGFPITPYTPGARGLRGLM